MGGGGGGVGWHALPRLDCLSNTIAIGLGQVCLVGLPGEVVAPPFARLTSRHPNPIVIGLGQVLADTYAKFAGGGGAAKIDVNQVLNGAVAPIHPPSLSPL